MSILPRSFPVVGKRIEPSKSIDPKFSVLLYCEGKNTEYSYFSGLKESLNYFAADLSSIWNIEPVPRGEDESGFSHITHLYAYALNDVQQGKIDPTYDTVWIVCDRDEQNNHRPQMLENIKKCQDEHFEVALTTPCFEFWLLLHHQDQSELDLDKVRRNMRISHDRRYLDKALSDVLSSGYSHGSQIDFMEFRDTVRDAVERTKRLNTRIEDLLDDIGSNIGMMLEPIIF